MKTIANCSPAEFLAQSWKMYDKLHDLLNRVGASEIRRRMPDLTGVENSEEKDKLILEQGKKNLKEILERLLTEFPDETAVVLGLACFIPESEINKHTGFELLAPVLEMIQNKEVISFFSSLAN